MPRSASSVVDVVRLLVACKGRVCENAMIRMQKQSDYMFQSGC